MFTKAIIITSITATLAAAPLSQANAAGKCDSAAKITADIWGELDTQFKDLGCPIIKIASGGAVPESACTTTAALVTKIGDAMVKFWNKNIGKDKWSTIGPRRLALGEPLQGTITSVGERMFITENAVDGDTVEISLEKLEGKGKTDVTVCTNYREKNEAVWSFTVDGDAAAGKVFKKTLTGVDGRLLKVHLAGKSATNKMKYKLTATAK